MRPPGLTAALVAVAIGAILTYAVSFTVSGLNIHTVGVIVMAVGAAALAILLARSVATSRRRAAPRRPQNTPGPRAYGAYHQDPVHGTPPVTATRSAGINTPSEQSADQPLYSEEAHRRSGTPRQ